MTLKLARLTKLIRNVFIAAIRVDSVRLAPGLQIEHPILRKVEVNSVFLALVTLGGFLRLGVLFVLEHLDPFGLVGSDHSQNRLIIPV